MGFKFDEKALINNNIFKYEEKLNSAYTRFLETTPTYVTYYNVNPIESTVDLGFSNVEKILGDHSPLKYSEVKNLPVYGMDSIQLNLEEGDEGLTVSYDNGELIILPDTIKPYPDDFFIIEHKGYDFLFRVTGVDYDTIKSNNFYKITFTIKYVDKEESKKILKQVTNKYTCVVDNIGTEDKCIIEDDVYELLNTMKTLYKQISDRYQAFYYKKKYNAFVFMDYQTGALVYDRYLNMFIQKHGLFYNTEDHRTIYLNNEDDDYTFLIEYDKSIYKGYELRKTQRLVNNSYRLTNIAYMYSVFRYYRLNNIKSIRFERGDNTYLSKDLLDVMISGNIPEENKFSEADLIIIKYIHDKIDGIHNLDLEELEELTYFVPSWDYMIKIPLLLYAMKGYYNLFIKKQSDN